MNIFDKLKGKNVTVKLLSAYTTESAGESGPYAEEFYGTIEDMTAQFIVFRPNDERDERTYYFNINSIIYIMEED